MAKTKWAATHPQLSHSVRQHTHFPLLSIAGAAHITGLRPSVLEAAMDAGTLHSIEIRERKISRAALELWLTNLPPAPVA